MTTITAPVPTADRDHALTLLALEHDDESRCVECLLPTDADDLVAVDGGLCLPCVRARFGDDIYGPCHGRDL